MILAVLVGVLALNLLGGDTSGMSAGFESELEPFFFFYFVWTKFAGLDLLRAFGFISLCS